MDVTSNEGAIVVGYDGSSDAGAAITWAADVARRFGAPLQVVSARELQVEPVRLAGGRIQWETSTRELLESAVQRVHDGGGGEPDTRLIDMPAVPALLEVSQQARLLVLGAQGHSALGGMLLGSVSQHLTRHAQCSVAVIRNKTAQPWTDVVVGVDGGPDCEAAVGMAFELAALYDVSVVALHGWPPRLDERPGGRLPVPGDVVDHVSAGLELLAQQTARWRERYPDVEVTTEAMPVHPARMLVDASRTAGAVVVGSRGRGAFAGMLLGSVSQSVLSNAHCPVIIAR